jgi:hypothetical protein
MIALVSAVVFAVVAISKISFDFIYQTNEN